jgi:hypothetical protein
MPVDVASHYLEEVRRQFRGHKLRRLRGVSEAGTRAEILSEAKDPNERNSSSLSRRSKASVSWS